MMPCPIRYYGYHCELQAGHEGLHCRQGKYVLTVWSVQRPAL